MNDAETTIAELKARMAEFIRQRDWQKYHEPKNLSMSLAIEAAEVMEFFQWADRRESAALAADPDARREIVEEISDVLAFLLSLANCLGVDLASSFEQKMRKNERKYPTDRVRGHYQRPPGDKE